MMRLQVAANVATPHEGPAMPEDSLQRDALAESGNVGVVADTIASPPSVVGVSNVGGVASRQVPICPFQHVSQSAGVDEQSLPYAFSVAPPLAQEPQAHGHLGGPEQLPREGVDTASQIGLDGVFLDFLFGGLIGGHDPVSQYES